MRIMFLRPFIPALLLVVVALGCGPETRTYEVVVRNATHRPLTVGVVKEGNPFEPAWATPEEAALKPGTLGRPSETAWDHMVIPPGERGYTNPIPGKFDGRARAVLRVYAGDLELSQVLAVNRSSPGRVDVVLPPGYSAFVISEDDAAGRLRADPTDEPPPAPASRRRGRRGDE